MKLKKNVIILSFIICFIFLIGIYFIKSKDIVFHSINTGSKKYYSMSYKDGVPKYGSNGQLECERYYEGVQTNVFKMDVVDERYPMYIVNGCATSISYYIEQTGKNKKACEAFKEYAEANLSSNIIVNDYNEVCSDAGTGTLVVDNKTCNCDIFSEKYIDYIDDYQRCKCTTKIKYDNYFFVEGDCESKRIFDGNKGYTGILRRRLFDEKNACDYPLFYKDGYAVSYDGYDDETSVKKFCIELKSEVENYFYNSDYAKFYASKWEYDEVCVKNAHMAPITNEPKCILNSPKRIISGKYNDYDFNKNGEFSGKGVVLDYTVVNQGYPIFLVNGEKWDYSDIINPPSNTSAINKFCTDDYDFKVAVCMAQYDFINNTNNKDLFSEFNTLCVDGKILAETYRLNETKLCGFTNDYKLTVSSGEKYSVNKFTTESECSSNSNPFKGKTGILSEKYLKDSSRPLYLLNGCAWEFSAIISPPSNISNTNKICANDSGLKKAVCMAEREYIMGDLYSRSDLIDVYNNNCIKTGILDSSYSINKSNSCGYPNLGDYKFNVSSGTKYDVEQFSDSCKKNCNLFKGKTGILLEEYLNNSSRPLYLLNGYPWNFADIINPPSNISEVNKTCLTGEFKKAVCKAEYEFINENTSSRKIYIDAYNQNCIDTGVLDSMYRIILVNSCKFPNNSNYKLTLTKKYSVSQFVSDCGKDTNPFKGESGILSEDYLTDASRPLYLLNGCSWNFADVIEPPSDISDINKICLTTEFKKAVCMSEYEFISEDPYSRSDYIDVYNQKCINTGLLDPTYKIIKSCGFPKTGNYTFEVLSGEKYSPTQFTHDCGDNTNPFKNQTGILLEDYLKNNNRTLYLINGCAWNFADVINVKNNDCIDDEFKKAVCNAEYEYISKDLNSRKIYIDTYNRKCIRNGILDDDYELEVPQYVKVVFNAYGAYGLSCNEAMGTINGIEYYDATSNNNECTYYFLKPDSTKTITLDSSVLPKTKISGGGTMYELSTGKTFSGWRRNSDISCNNGNITIDIPTTSTTIEFSACYSGSSIDHDRTGALIFNNCSGSYTKYNDAAFNTKFSQTVNVSNSPILTSNINAEKLYKNDHDFEEAVNNGNNFKINKYCSITCKENFNYLYPSIFESVKSGTYFELLSYPEIRSQLMCTETFNFDSWELDYDNAILKEKEAYVEKENSAIIKNLINNISSYCTSYCDGWDHGNCIDTDYKCVASNIQYYKIVSNDVQSDSIDFNIDKETNVAQSEFKEQIISNIFSGYDSTIDYSKQYDVAKNKRVNYEKSNRVCFNALYQKTDNSSFAVQDKPSSGETQKFYKVSDAKINFYYESDTNGLEKAPSKIGSNYSKEELSATNTYLFDSGVHYSGDDKINFSYDEIEKKDSYGSETINFTARKLSGNLQRTVINNYVFNYNASHPTYYTINHTGEIKEGSGDIKLGYVYPIKLTLHGNRKVYFAIDANTNLTYGANVLLDDNDGVLDEILYECNYDISNDIIVKEKTVDKYKKNFYVRSVSAKNVDPNDRFENGTLGANWADDKGQALIDIIEKKSEGNNTYNPENLEYSFTLNAGTIEAIRGYNKTVGRYDNFDNTTYECNNLGGECESKFLTLLAGSTGTSKVNGIVVNGVNAVMKRESWKYYIDGKWMKTKSLTDSSNWINIMDSTSKGANDLLGTCRYDYDAKLTYDCIYRNINEGVLP